MTEEKKEEQVATEGITEDAGQQPADVEAAPKKKRKKWPIIVGVIVAVIVVAGAGFMVWHEQPSFCNAICHTPMDPYLPTYEATPGEAAMDKWGNEIADASAMLAPVHRVEANATCMGCHVPSLGEQISEGMSWISGNYVVVENPTYGSVLEERDLTELVAARGIEEDEFCLNESCHNITREDLIQLTSSYERNPHVAQHSEQACSNCHKAHRASVNWCSSCHADAPIPDGWMTVAEANKLAA